MMYSVKYVNEFDYLNIFSFRAYLPVSSIIPFSSRIPSIELKRDLRFAIEEDLYVHIDNKREPQGTYKVVYNPATGPINVANEELIAIQIGGEHIYIKFLPAQITS